MSLRLGGAEGNSLTAFADAAYADEIGTTYSTAGPCPNSAYYHASLPSRQGSAKRGPPLSSWNKTRYTGNTKEKASLAALQFGLLVHA